MRVEEASKHLRHEYTNFEVSTTTGSIRFWSGG